jgi:hypothetical protein
MTTVRYQPTPENLKLEVLRHHIDKLINDIEKQLRIEGTALGQALCETQIRTLEQVLKIVDIVANVERDMEEQK